MVQCLLCLKSNRETAWCIEVDSLEWKENKIKEVIEKHLWLIDTIKRNSWLCHPCWEEIKDFHNFYNRIEEAHKVFSIQIKKELEEPTTSTPKKDKKQNDIAAPARIEEAHTEPSVEIKQELEEPTTLTPKEYQNQMYTAALGHEFHREPKFDNSCSFSQNDSNDDIPLMRRQCSGKYMTKSSTDKKLKDENIGEYENKSHLDADPLRPSEDGETERNPSKQSVDHNELSIEIKQELEEPTTLTPKECPNQNFIAEPDHEFREEAKSDNACNFSQEDSNDDMPLMRRLRTEKNMTKSSTDSKPNSNSEDEYSDEYENRSDSDADPLRPSEDGQTKRKRCKQSNRSRKSYYKPKSSRLDQDKFIQEHFKITCNKCNLHFDIFPQLCKHYRQEHNERAYVTCCETKFFVRSILFDHLHFHLNPDYFKCQECGKAFGKRSNLIAHTKLHEGKKPYRCNVCDKSFAQKHRMERHKETHMSEEEKKHPCDECGKFFANEYVLGVHKRVVHLGIYAKVCELCGQTMRNTYSFKHHMRTHEICSGTSSPSSNSLSVKCDECGLLLAGSMHLKEHCKNQHPADGKRDYKCHICPKVSPTLRALKRHIKSYHETGNEHKCTLCEKVFKRQDKLKVHMAVHKSTPPYRCTWCPKTFNFDGNMYKHKKRMHPIEWEQTKRRKYADNLPPNSKTPTTENS